MGKNIGFVSTRFAGTDGVTLESSKWATVLRRNGHSCFWFAGKLDRAPERSFLAPEAFFHHQENKWIDAQVFGKKRRDAVVTDAIHSLKSALKLKLREFINKFSIDLLIAQNVLTIPMHIPLGIALTELLAETQIPTIAHHHDFFWERTRFIVNAVGDYLRMAFPPNLSNIEHVVINSAAQEELALRTGLSSIIIPNVLDFEHPPVVDATHTEEFRKSIGLTRNDSLILQPTRIIQRKGIEHAIELVEDLNDPRCKLVVSHEAEEEDYEYSVWLTENARERGVDLRMIDLRISNPMSPGVNDHDKYSLWDVYPHADFITYPSLYEGFGNAFLEAVYFKKPLLINRYATFVRDIEPRGFDLAVMDGFLTRATVQKVREILESPARRDQMVNTNYAIAARHYSFAVLERWLKTILTNFFGMPA
ncbi:MAG: glycosyltransferase family 4 protein [Desulfobacterales bacterium]|nr:MAG: glycosyltransferase family 4 protein [Desulfobacterales bacterium]